MHQTKKMIKLVELMASYVRDITPKLCVCVPTADGRAVASRISLLRSFVFHYATHFASVNLILLALPI